MVVLVMLLMVSMWVASLAFGVVDSVDPKETTTNCLKFPCANRKSHGDCNNNQGHVHHTAMRFVSPTTGW